jgi:hypothetical protein
VKVVTPSGAAKINTYPMKSPQLTELTASEMETISGGLQRRGGGRGLGLLILLVLALLLRRRQTEAVAAE